MPVKRLYLIPGQGSDERLFKNIRVDSVELVRLHWILPQRGETMNALAHRMAEQIDTTQPYAIAGVSMGGMVACEMSTFLHPEKIFIISSARGRQELPKRYRMLRHFPLHRIIPPGLFRFGARVLQPLVEPDRKKEKTTCRAMLRDKDPLFLKRSTDCIVCWNTSSFSSSNIVHIHGTHDHTLPYRKVSADYTVNGGSHMMALTRGDEISGILQQSLLSGHGTKP